MKVLTEVLTHSESAVVLPMEPIMYGVIALSIFALLAFITVSYRDVANRHSHKVSDDADHGHGTHH